MVQLSQPHMTTGKTIALIIWAFVSRVMSLFQYTVWVCHNFPAEKQSSLISWLQSRFAVILEPKRGNLSLLSTFSPSFCHEVMGPDAMILVFLIFSLKPALSLSPFTLIRGSWVPLRFLPLEWWYLRFWGCWCFSRLSWFQVVTHAAQHFSWCALHIS